MPIDYLSLKNKAQGNLDNLLSNRPGLISSGIDKTRSNIEAGRAPVFDALSKVSPLAGQTISSYTPKLNRSTEETLAQQKFGQQRTQSNLLYQNVLQQALDAGYDLQSATAYARQYSSDQQRRQFESQQNAVSRMQQQRLLDLQTNYANRGLDLEGQYNMQPDYNSAMLRVLIGSGTALGSAYLGSKLYGKPDTIPTKINSNVNSSYYPNPKELQINGDLS